MAQTSGRILVIDDNKDIHDDFRKIFSGQHNEKLDELEAAFLQCEIKEESQEIQIDSAYQGQAGFELVEASVARNEPYDIAFVDMRMPPGWDGVVTLEHIFRVDPELLVVICSAYSDHSWKEINHRLGDLGRFLILKKPFDVIEVIQLCHAATDHQPTVFASKQLRSEECAADDSFRETVRVEVNKIHQRAVSRQGLSGGVADQLKPILEEIVQSGENLLQLVRRT